MENFIFCAVIFFSEIPVIANKFGFGIENC